MQKNKTHGEAGHRAPVSLLFIDEVGKPFLSRSFV